MTEVPNQKILDRYKELLANRTHDVIVRDAALEMLESELKSQRDSNQTLAEENETLKRKINNQDERIIELLDKMNEATPSVIQGEVVERDED